MSLKRFFKRAAMCFLVVLIALLLPALWLGIIYLTAR